MLKIENYEVLGWEHAIRGMRNPKNSWVKSDSSCCTLQQSCMTCPANTTEGCPLPGDDPMAIGPNDHKLMMSLAKGGPVHAKYRRMITVYLDITAPMYWWKEFDTYKVGTVANSCSTMHKIHAKEITLDDFSCEWCSGFTNGVINTLETWRKLYLETGDKKYWYAIIQLMPMSYNQKRTVMLNYEVLHNIYHSRKNHKLDEWHVFCDWIESLPYSEIITGESDNT